jgi:hypothetical protein
MAGHGGRPLLNEGIYIAEFDVALVEERSDVPCTGTMNGCDDSVEGDCIKGDDTVRPQMLAIFGERVLGRSV